MRPEAGKKAVFITGAAKRVGREIALHLAAQGYDIALHYHSSATDAGATAKKIRALGAACEIFAADLAEIEALPELVSRVRKSFPHCRNLVNNASIFERGPFPEADFSSYEQHMRINLAAPVFLTRAFVNAAKGEMLAIVNIIDARVKAARHSYFFYLLSKKALLDFTEMAAAALGPDARVNAVLPGMVMESADGNFDAEYRAKWKERLSLGALPMPAEVAEAVHILLATPSLTGQTLFIDGGEG